jgi:hypothetical protein
MQDTIDAQSDDSLMTLADALRQNKGVTCDFFLAALLQDSLLRGDSLGRFWRVVDDPLTALKLDTNSLWLFCCSPLLSTR